METEKLSAPTAPLGCFLLLLPKEAELHRAGWEPRQRGLGTASSQANGWRVLILGGLLTLGSAGSWAPSLPTRTL